MRTKKEVIEYYGKCCVSEYLLTENRNYPDSVEGQRMVKTDNFKLERIRGQKIAIEYIMDG